jgi:hypothetical protein
MIIDRDDPQRPARIRRLRKPIITLAALSVILPFGIADGHYRSSITIIDVEETLPPIVLGEQSFAVVVHKKQLVWPAEASHRFDPDDDETAVSFEVCDDEENVVYRQDVLDDPAEVELPRIRQQGRFPNSYSVHSYCLEGSAGRALMVNWSFLPSAPNACTTHVVLGLIGDRLAPFGEPFCESFESPRELTAAVWPLKRDEQTGDDVLEVRRLTGYFSVIVPVRVGFLAGKLLPARRCLRLNERARWVELCEFSVQAHREPLLEDTFVRLFPRPDTKAIPHHVVVKPDSPVEFLSALTPNIFDEAGTPNPSTGEQVPWLKVRIAGKEGWVREDEDLRALGLRQAG